MGQESDCLAEFPFWELSLFVDQSSGKLSSFLGTSVPRKQKTLSTFQDLPLGTLQLQWDLSG